MNTHLLRKALSANIIFSTFSAILSILFYKAWPPINQMASGNGLIFGIQLLIFAGFILFVVVKQKFTGPFIYSIIVLDILYVLGSTIRLLMDKSLTIEGYLLVGLSSAIVSTFAVLQWQGYRLFKAEKSK